MYCGCHAGYGTGNDVAVLLVEGRFLSLGLVVAENIFVHELSGSAGALELLAGENHFFAFFKPLPYQSAIFSWSK